MVTVHKITSKVDNAELCSSCILIHINHLCSTTPLLQQPFDRISFSAPHQNVARSTPLLRCDHLYCEQVDALHMSHNGHHEVIHCAPLQHISHRKSSHLHHQVSTQKSYSSMIGYI